MTDLIDEAVVREVSKALGVSTLSPHTPVRVRMPDTRNSITHKFTVADHEGYIVASVYPNGEIGEMFFTMAKEGSTISGLFDTIATTTSVGLQHGVPLFAFLNRWVDQRFEPSGFTKNANIREVSSIMDYIARWLAIKFLSKKDIAKLNIALQDRGLLPIGTKPQE